LSIAPARACTRSATERQHYPAGAGVAADRCHHQLAGARDDLVADVVDRLNVAPGLDLGAGRGLDDVEVDPVGEDLAAAEHQHPVSWAMAVRRAAASRSHWPLDMAPLWNAKRSTPTGPERQ
jgi:hypothetical protein